MAKLTKAQKKRMVSEIHKKSQKLFTTYYWPNADGHRGIISTKDMEAIDKLCAKWMKRIG